MADVSSAPAIGAPTALYPQPPQQQPALGSNPGQMLDLLGKIQQNYQLQQELKARAAIGQAYQGALTPGGLDPEKLRAGLSNPDAAWALPETMTHVLQQQGQQFNVLAGQDQAARALIGSLPPNATDEDLRHYAVTGARAGIPPAIMQGHVESLMQLKGKDRARAIAVLQGTALGPAGVSERVTGAPTEGGAPTQESKGTTILREAQGTGAGGGYRGTPVGQPPGQAELQQAASASAARLEASANSTAQYHADLDNLRQLSKDIPLQGPTAEFEKKLNQVTTRLGFGTTMTADQLAKSEEFAKIASQIALNQSSLFHGSDAGLQMNVSANPNLEISKYGREGVIAMLQGNQDALDTLRKMWFNAKRGYKKDTGQDLPANSYNDFVQEASQRVNPRVFQFMRMNDDQRAEFLKGVSDKAEFERQLLDADRRKWIKLPEAEKGPSGPPPLQPGASKNQDRASQGEPGKALPEPPPKPPVPGIRLGRRADGTQGWFIEDPNRPGKHMEVRIPGLGQ